jgi:hypothetical protein
MNVSEPEITSVTDLTNKELIEVVNNYNLKLQVQPRTEKKHIKTYFCSKLTPERVVVARAG